MRIDKIISAARGMRERYIVSGVHLVYFCTEFREVASGALYLSQGAVICTYGGEVIDRVPWVKVKEPVAIIEVGELE